LIDAGVVAAIGADVSGVTLAIAPVFQQAEIILMSPASSTPKLSNAGNFIYRNFPSDDLEALNTADHVFNFAHVT
jgi:branched-chain amino acid transport system substrate-binding protein